RVLPPRRRRARRGRPDDGVHEHDAAGTGPARGRDGRGVGRATGPRMSEHPAAGLDETVHQRHRLGILTIAAEAGQVDFGYLRRTLDMTAGNLSRHVTILEEAGLIDVEKG